MAAGVLAPVPSREWSASCTHHGHHDTREVQWADAAHARARLRARPAVVCTDGCCGTTRKLTRFFNNCRVCGRRAGRALRQRVRKSHRHEHDTRHVLIHGGIPVSALPSPTQLAGELPLTSRAFVHGPAVVAPWRVPCSAPAPTRCQAVAAAPDGHRSDPAGPLAALLVRVRRTQGRSRLQGRCKARQGGTKLQVGLCLDSDVACVYVVSGPADFHSGSWCVRTL